MLIHVTRFTAVQERVWNQVNAYVSGVRQRLERNIDSEQILKDLRGLWETDFVPTTARVSALLPDDVPEGASSGWDAIANCLASVCGDISVRKINGTAKDVLDYVDNKGTGLKVIAIGGDKLARGLTLEGLTTSYFLRASRMYDTLMQMGRWFGYRPGYLDLCRLYTTQDLIDWFGHIAEASEELRRDFDLMAQSGSTPMDYGLRVQSHSVLMVTSQVKMRAARNLMLSFSGESVETVTFLNDKTTLADNFQALQTLISRLSDPEVNPKRIRESGKEQWQGHVWNDVDSSSVVDFLTHYRTHPAAHRVNTQLLSEFIVKMNGCGELTRWTIALVGSKDGQSQRVADGVTVGMLVRQDRKIEGRYSIGRLLSPRDEAIDLDEDAWKAALELSRSSFKKDPARGRVDLPDSPSGPAIRHVRGFGSGGGSVKGSKKGLLLLYVLDYDASRGGTLVGVGPVVAFGLSFPCSKAGEKVEYKVNNVKWEQEYGHSE
jgi:hypothetical protein